MSSAVQSIRVLVVDDDAAIRDLLETVLRKDGYEVTTVTADGCDSSSGDYSSYLDAVGSLEEVCDYMRAMHGGWARYSDPIDGHGIIYTIDMIDREPVLTVHYRYHITAN
jgi:hypothetical protein